MRGHHTHAPHKATMYRLSDQVPTQKDSKKSQQNVSLDKLVSLYNLISYNVQYCLYITKCKMT